MAIRHHKEMIEILTLAASVTKIAGAVSSAIKAGKDLSGVMPLVGKLGELDAQIQIAETGQHKGVFSKLTTTEQEALAVTQAKIAHKRAMDDLRSYMMLFCPVGTWEQFQKELSHRRKLKADQLKREAKKRRDREMVFAVIMCVIVLASGVYALIEWIEYLRATQWTIKRQ